MSVQPNFFIVGAPKSGTTSLHNYLAEHPDICMSDPKEPAYWSTDFSSPLFYSNPASYSACFSKYRGQSRIGESTTCYLYSEVAASNIFKHLPDAKIIAMIRNPLTMVPALHTQYLKMGLENIESLQDALTAEDARSVGNRMPSRFPFPKEFLLYRKVAKYSEQIQRFQNLFGQENMLIVLFEDFLRDASQVYHEVCSFLGVSTEFKPKFSWHNPAQTPRSVKLQRLARRATQVALPKVLRNFESVERIFENGKTQLLDVVSRFNLTKPTRKLDNETHQNLASYYEAEIDRLEHLLDRSLNCWQQ